MTKDNEERRPKTITIREDGAITVSDAADLLGCTRSAINSHIKEDGAPVVERGRAGVSSWINLGDYVRWLTERAEARVRDPEEDEDFDGRLTDDQRYKRARARREELAEIREEMAVKRELKEIAYIEDVSRYFEDLYSDAAASLRNVPKRASARAAALTDVRAISDILTQEIAEAMQSVADTRAAMRGFLGDDE